MQIFMIFQGNLNSSLVVFAADSGVRIPKPDLCKNLIQIVINFSEIETGMQAIWDRGGLTAINFAERKK